MRTQLLSLALLFIVPLYISAGELWSSTIEGFGAMFPNNPEKVGAATSRGPGHAYQSAERFRNGGALYAITVVPVPSSIKPASFDAFLEGSHDAFVKSMGGDPGLDTVSWSTFGDERERLDYSFDFTYSGIPFTGRGFWIMDRGRAIRVSVSYTQSLTPKEIDEALRFPDSFVILTQ